MNYPVTAPSNAIPGRIINETVDFGNSFTVTHDESVCLCYSSWHFVLWVVLGGCQMN